MNEIKKIIYYIITTIFLTCVLPLAVLTGLVEMFNKIYDMEHYAWECIKKQFFEEKEI